MEPIQLPCEKATDSELPSWMKRSGVYLITGGLGGLGICMAEYLAKCAQARLVLVSRSGLPPRGQWDQVQASSAREGNAQKIEAVRRLERMGTEVLVARADVTDEKQMRSVVQQALARFGSVDGVIHAAGVPGAGLSQLKTPAMLATVLGPKVHGTVVLEKALAAEKVEPDFLVLFSSVAAITGGGPGQFDYCAANAFLDAYAHSRAGHRTRTVSINWSEWQWNAWTEGLSTVGNDIRQYLEETRKKFGITFSEGQQALGRILSSTLPQVIVSTQDFCKVFERTKTLTSGAFGEGLKIDFAAVSKHRRPDLHTPFVPPGGRMEKLVAEIWEAVLGVDKVGVQDNFFELGGNSLVAMQVMSRLRQVAGVDLSLSVVSSSPTVADMAVAAELSMIENLEKLSEEEAQNLVRATAVS